MNTLFALVSWLSPPAAAQEPAPGESFLALYTIHPELVAWWNVAMVGADDKLWLALEEYNPDYDPSAHGMRAVRFDTVGESTEENELIQEYDDLIGQGMYPSILTWSGAANAFIVTKQTVDQSSGNAHLRVVTQDRDDFSSTPSFEAVTSSTTSYHHNKPFIARDTILPERFLCWTRESDSNPSDQDVWSKPKDASTWLGSTDRSVSTTADEEDHCMMDFHYDGTRYLVYHREREVCDDDEDAGCNDNVDNDGDGLIDEDEDETWLKITTWDGSTWTNVAHFALPGSPDNDFPSVWTQSTGIIGQSMILVAAQGNANVNVWSCTGSVASCDQASNFAKTSNAVSNATDPKIFAVSRGFEEDQFIVYQKDGAEPRVRIASRCDGASGWTDEGTLPLPFGYDNLTDMHLGISTSSSNPQVHTDGSTFFVSFFAQDQDDLANPTTLMDPATWYETRIYRGSSSEFGCN